MVLDYASSQWHNFGGTKLEVPRIETPKLSRGVGNGRGTPSPAN